VLIVSKQGKRFFFEKKNQKTFVHLAQFSLWFERSERIKVFASFFKKKRLLSTCGRTCQ